MSAPREHAHGNDCHLFATIITFRHGSPLAQLHVVWACSVPLGGLGAVAEASSRESDSGMTWRKRVSNALVSMTVIRRNLDSVHCAGISLDAALASSTMHKQTKLFLLVPWCGTRTSETPCDVARCLTRGLPSRRKGETVCLAPTHDGDDDDAAGERKADPLNS